jgi:hypothetical protein
MKAHARSRSAVAQPAAPRRERHGGSATTSAALRSAAPLNAALRPRRSDSAEADADRIAQVLTAPPSAARGAVRPAAAAAGAPSDGGPGPSTLLRGTGQPLPPAQRAQFEARLGQELSGVRLHVGAEAHTMARSMNAAAFTYGQHIAFADGWFRPGTRTGQRLLAHEVAHTLQQRHGAPHVQRETPDEAKAKAELDKLQADDVCPMPADDMMSFPVVGGGTIRLSSSTAHVRREVALLIAEQGLQDAESSVRYVQLLVGPGPSARKKLADAMQAQFEALRTAWVAFSAQVRNAGIARLKMNHAALGEWSAFVAQLEPGSLMNQTLASQEMNWMGMLAKRTEAAGGSWSVGPYDMRDMAERRAWSDSPGFRNYVQSLARGDVRSGCGACHALKAIPDYDATFGANDPARLSPVIRLQGAALQEATGPTAWNSHIGGRPVAAAAPSDATWSYASGQPGLSSVAESSTAIGSRIQPLVDQYKVVPPDVINRATTPEQLKAAVLAAIERRRNEFVDMQGKLAQPDYNFLQLLPLVDAFIGQVDSHVRAMIRGVQAKAAADKKAEQEALTGLGILAFFLTIFPPTSAIGLAMGAGLAVAGIAQGYGDYMQGMEYKQGTSAEIFSPEQEAAATGLMASGLMNILFSSLSLVGSAASVRGMLGRTAAPTSTALARSTGPAAMNAAESSMGPQFAWTMLDDGATSGVARAVAKNLAPGGQEYVLARFNVRTGMGQAVITTPSGTTTVPIVNYQPQFRTPAGLLPAGPGFAGSPVTAMVPVGGAAAASPAATLPPGLVGLPSGQGASFLRGYLPAGEAPLFGVGPPARPHLGSRVILPSNAPAAGQAPVYNLPLGPEGQSGVMLMNRGLRPTDFGNNGKLGNMVADDAVHLELWTQAEAKAARSPKMNNYRRWLAAVDDGSVVTWSNKRLGKAYSVLRKEYKDLATQRHIDFATLHHWNYNKSLYPYQVVDPRNLFVVYGKGQLVGGYHPTHHDGLHPLTTSGHPTRSPIDPIHAQPLQNTPAVGLNPNYPGMPAGWHPPMQAPEVPFGWSPQTVPQWNWPGGVPPTRPPR